MLQENQLFANRYRLVKRLGQGAFSEVWKAEDTKVGNLTVALKVYAPDKGLDEDGAKVFGDEFAIVFNVHHSNLLTPSTFDEENNSPYLVLPFCERGSAVRLIGNADERQVAQFLRDVSSALAYLHESEIVHQDIKPDNVLMDTKGNFLVTDFGISTRMRSTLRRSVGGKSSAGTMAYMGPERFSTSPKPIKASDIWSLGATVYELMTGDVPFGDMGGGMQQAGAFVPDVEGDYSSELKKLVKRCLSKEPWDRPTAAQLRDISEEYLRTGIWNLSTSNNSSSKNPVSSADPTRRKTEKKARTEVEFGTKKMASENSTPKVSATTSISQNHVFWIIGGVVALALLVLATVNLINNHRVKIPATDAGKYVVKGVSFTMKPVDGGTFTMGCTPEQIEQIIWTPNDRNYPHTVSVHDYCIGETEVTQDLWKAVMGSAPSMHKGKDLPVEQVSWNDCQKFITRLNELTGKTFRLPTEAEWEYAARGGKQSKGYKYSGSNNLDDVAWYNTNSNERTHSVKQKKANELGLYDMSGNVWEWCSDWYGDFDESGQTDPTGPLYGDKRVVRGMDYSNDHKIGVSFRMGIPPDDQYPIYGFRLALSR